MARALVCVRCQGRAFGRHCKTCERLEVIDRQVAREMANEASISLTGGEWVPADGIMRWVPNGPPREIHGGPQLVSLELPEDVRRDAHRRYWLGERSAEVVVGEREYQRDQKRRARAARRAMQEEVA